MIKHSIFPYFVLDGGAFNLMNDHFGTANGDDILELTLSGKLFEFLQYNGEFNWQSSFAFTDGTDFRKKYEWQIWPQRLQFTIPLAHKFLKTGDRKYADAWLKIVKNWYETHPYQEFDESISLTQTDMVWRDMQVAWRMFSLLHGMFMLQDAPFTKDEWKYLYDFIEIHKKHLYTESLYNLRKNIRNNHVLQIGSALLLTISMFPEFDNNDEIRNISLDSIEDNLKNAVYDDGGSIEESPSYSHFIARILLEDYLIIKNNGFPQINGLLESIKKQYNLLYQCMTPLGTSLSNSDSFSLDAKKDIEYAQGLIALDLNNDHKSAHFPNNNITIFRQNETSLFVITSAWPGPHHHAGTPGLISFYKKDPILIDGGVCNYDRWEFYHHLIHAKSHSVVYCDDFDDIFKFSAKPKIESLDLEKGTMTIKTNVRHNDGRGYNWTRSIEVSDKKIIIEDEAVSETELPFKSRFLFRQNCVNFPNPLENRGFKNTHSSYDGSGVMQLLTKKYIMTLTSSKKIRQELSPVMNEDNKLDYAVVAECSEFTKVFKNRTVLEFKDR